MIGDRDQGQLDVPTLQGVDHGPAAEASYSPAPKRKHHSRYRFAVNLLC
jgi:hypothetical protein